VTAKCQITHKNAKYSATQSVSVIAGLTTTNSSSSRHTRTEADVIDFRSLKGAKYEELTDRTVEGRRLDG